jgi:serine/threonine-protein kinase
MAPEILRSPRVDYRADLYSLGAMMYELMLGEAPIDAPVLPMLIQRLSHDTPPAPCSIRPDFPEVLSRVLSATLGKRPTDRYPRAEYMSKDLERWLADPDVGISELYCQALPNLWENESAQVPDWDQF